MSSENPSPAPTPPADGQTADLGPTAPPAEAPVESSVEASVEVPVDSPAPADAAAAIDAAMPEVSAEATAAADSAAPVEPAEAALGEPPGPGTAAPARIDLEACAAELKQRFPALFAGPPKPIKLRIQTDIQLRAPGVFTRQALSAFLRRHTGSTSYLIALGKATQRLDLDGQPAGEISAEHHDAAVQELARRRALRREREQAMRQAQRPARAPRDPAGGPAAPADTPAPDAAGPGTDATPPQPMQRPPRPPRPPRQGPRDRPQGRGEREQGPRPQGQQAQGPRRPDGPRPQAQARPAQPQAHPQRPEDRPPREAANRPPPTVDDPARRERQQLMRAFDGSPLTKANFCALKGITVDHLDSQLALARQEAAAWAAAHPQPERTQERSLDRAPDRGFDRRPDHRPQGPRDGRSGGPRRGNGPAQGGVR